MISQASPAAGPLRTDASKRVNYTLGLVLGVDEFQQDQLYHAAGRRGHNRLLHGYGTVWGLRVNPVPGGAEPEIQVEPGMAVDPCGREICVADLMCVKLNRWLQVHETALKHVFGSGGRTLPLAVILCHRECPTDTVPVPGEPCRSQDDAMQPSRIRDGFELKLALRDDAPWGVPTVGSPPGPEPTGLTVYRTSQPEERAVRAFGHLLGRVETTDSEVAEGGRAELLAAVRALRHAVDEDVIASPPAADNSPILLPADRAREILREAFGVWVTEVRPAIRGEENPNTCGDGGGECCVLLAEVDLPVTHDWVVVGPSDAAPNPIRVREDSRPYLLHTRLLQEWLLANSVERRPDVDSFATLQVLGPHRIRAWVHHQAALTLPPAAVQVRVNEVPRTVARVIPAGIRNVWDIVFPEPAVASPPVASPPDDPHDMNDGDVVEVRFDAEQVLLAGSPPRSVADDLREGSGEYLDRDVWALPAYTVYNKLEGGDLAGEYLLPIVAKIQKFPVAPTTPAVDQYLYSDGTKWMPRALPPGTKDLAGVYPANVVRGLQGRRISATAPAELHFLQFRSSGSPPGAPEWTPTELRFSHPSDIAGRYDDVRVTALQRTPVSADPPKAANQVLAYTGREWAPADAGAVLGPAGGDLQGTYPSPTIAKLQGKDVAASSPAAGHLLQFQKLADGTLKWVSAPLTVAFGLKSDLTGFPETTVRSLKGQPFTAAPTSLDKGHVLTWNGAAWVNQAPAATSGGATGTAGNDLRGTYPNPTVVGIQNQAVAAGTAPGQVHVFNGTSWDAVDGAAQFGTRTPYELFAAGHFDLAGKDPNGNVLALHSYNGLALGFAGSIGNNALFELRIPGLDILQWVYIVKALASRGVAALVQPKENVFQLEFIRLGSSNERSDLHVEVSRYPRKLDHAPTR
jgi:hypothetical protein